MAQTKKKRRRKHRGTQGGRIDPNRRAGRPRSREEAKARARAGRSKPAPKIDAPPTWRSSVTRGVVAAVIFTVLLMLLFKRPAGAALGLGAFMLVFYIPAGYCIDTTMWRKRERARIRDARRSGSEPRRRRCSPSGRSPRTASSLRREGADRGLIVDPGDEAERILAAVEEMGGEGRGDPDHPLPLRPHRRGRAGGDGHRRPGLLPGARAPVLADIMAYVPCPGIRPVRELRGRRDGGAAARRWSSPG